MSIFYSCECRCVSRRAFSSFFGRIMYTNLSLLFDQNSGYNPAKGRPLLDLYALCLNHLRSEIETAINLYEKDNASKEACLYTLENTISNNLSFIHFVDALKDHLNAYFSHLPDLWEINNNNKEDGLVLFISVEE